MGEDNWFSLVRTFIKKRFWYDCIVHNPDEDTVTPTIGIMENLDGYSTHAVIMHPGSDNRILHDPNLHRPIYKRTIAKIELRRLPRKLDMTRHFKEGDADAKV
jgi:hypothetical protein